MSSKAILGILLLLGAATAAYNGNLTLNVSHDGILDAQANGTVVNGTWFMLFNFTPNSSLSYNFSYAIDGVWRIFPDTKTAFHQFGAFSIAGNATSTTTSSNYTTAISFNGTTNKTLTLERLNMTNLTASFTDLSCDTGTTFPTNIQNGTCFFLQMTNRAGLFVWDGSIWNPTQGFGNWQMFVDGALGTDNQTQGDTNGTGAFKTIQYAINQVPNINLGSVAINISAGVYAENLSISGKLLQGGNSLTIQGQPLSEIATDYNGTPTLFSPGNNPAVAGTQTYPSCMDTNESFGANQTLFGKFAQYNDTSAWFPIYKSNNTSFCVAENSLLGITKYRIKTLSTIVKNSGNGQLLTIPAGQTGLIINFINFENNGSGNTLRGGALSATNFNYIKLKTQQATAGSTYNGISTFTNSALYTLGTGSPVMAVQGGGYLTLTNCAMWANGTNGYTVRNVGSSVQFGAIVAHYGANKAAYGVSLISSAGSSLFRGYFEGFLTAGVLSDASSTPFAQYDFYMGFNQVPLDIIKPWGTRNADFAYMSNLTQKYSVGYNITTDALMFSNGTNTTTPANQQVAINSSGLVLMHRQWDDMTMPLITARPPASGNADCDTAFLNTTKACAFSTGESLEASLQMSHSYALGTDINCHIHWTSANNNTGNIIWGLEYTKQDMNLAFPATTTIYCTASNPSATGAYTHRVCDFGSIGNFTGLSGIAMARIFRNTTGDTYGSDAFGLSLDFHYQKDTIGSASEYGKWS